MNPCGRGRIDRNMIKKENTVERAIIMAAGKGERLRPVTLTTPKPLVAVNGVRMIDSVIRGLHENDITEIYVVTGYLKERFDTLPMQYPGVRLIENPLYESWNNIASLYAARHYLSNCMILDGDQMIYRPEVLDKHFQLSGYNAVWTEEETAEWLLDVEDGHVRGCSRTGGSHGWQLYSVSRWTDQDGQRLRGHLEAEFERGNKDIYWDDVALFCYPEHYDLGIFEMKKGDVVEIDNFNELIQLDPSYTR